MKHVTLGLAVGAWVFIVLTALQLSDRDMKVCQLTHSHDVCVETLR